MAIDRAVVLRNAEKLIRQGKLEPAIAEFLRLLEETPDDWNLRNTIGDLYARAGQVDKAVEQYMEIANSLNDEGSVAKASAIYKKILKTKPDHEHALVQIADILGSQGLYADARNHLKTLIELRSGRGDTRGAIQAKIRLGSLDPEDYEGRLTAASARIELGDVGGAMNDLKEIATELAGKGREAEAVEVLHEAAKLNPNDDEVKEKLFEVYLAQGELAQARASAVTLDQFRSVASAFEAAGQGDLALAVLREAAAAHDYDNDLKAQLAKAFVARGDLATAAEYLTVETAGDDPALLMTVADIKLRGDQLEDGLAILRQLIEADPSRREDIALLGWSVAEQNPDNGFRAVELAAETAIAQDDWPGAAAALQEFVTRVPNHIPALMRLVEICVDGGLDATMYSAQAQLADAYIATGQASEARFIAEDLVAREPWEKSNIERFRRALVLLGEPDPDGLIASRLSGESPFTATDLSFGDGQSIFDEPPEEPEPSAPSLRWKRRPSSIRCALNRSSPTSFPRRAPTKGTISRSARTRSIVLSASSATSRRRRAASRRRRRTARSISASAWTTSSLTKPIPRAGPLRRQSGDLDGVFGQMRDEAPRAARASTSRRRNTSAASR